MHIIYIYIYIIHTYIITTNNDMNNDHDNGIAINS